jgi:hypothetical protein
VAVLRVNGYGKMVPCLFDNSCGDPLPLNERKIPNSHSQNPKIWERHTTCYESRGGLTDISNAKSNALQFSFIACPLDYASERAVLHCLFHETPRARCLDRLFSPLAFLLHSIACKSPRALPVPCVPSMKKHLTRWSAKMWKRSK